MLTSAGSRKVLLFLPPYAGKVLGPPLGLLSLAGSLREAGYQSEIIDGALDRDYMQTIREHAADCACFGVSLLTGPMILDAIEASKMFRTLRPDLPIIYGGWHPSLLTGETLREDFVDIVVRHQGEQTLVEILDRLAAGKPLDLWPVAGLSIRGRFDPIRTGARCRCQRCRRPHITLSIWTLTRRPAPCANCRTRRAPAVRTPATTARTWFFITAVSMLTRWIGW